MRTTTVKQSIISLALVSLLALQDPSLAAEPAATKADAATKTAAPTKTEAPTKTDAAAAAALTEPSAEPTYQFDISAIGLWTDVDGDSARFRAMQQREAPFSGGLEKFWWAGENDAGVTYEVNGRALYESDYGIDLKIAKPDVGSVHVIVDSYRRYYDSTVTYYPYPPQIYETLNELYTDRSRYSIEAILALPNMPQFTFGYERSGKDGNQDLPWGGWLRQAPPGNDWILWTIPLYREVDYITDRAWFGIDHTIAGFDLRFRQEWEKFDSSEFHREPGYYTSGVKVFDRYYRNTFDHTTWTTRVDLNKDLIENQLSLGMGYVYQNITNDNVADVDSRTPGGAIHYGEHSLNYNNNTHTGSLGRHVARANLTWRPTDKTTVTGALKYTHGDADSLAYRNEEGSGATAGDGSTATNEEVWTFRNGTIEESLNESLRVSFPLLPKTRATISADFEQSNIDYDWNALIWTAGIPGESLTGQGNWFWDALTDYTRSKYSLNLRSDLAKWLSSNFRYKYKLTSADVSEAADVASTKPGDPEFEPTATPPMFYPGRLEGWDRSTHDFSLTFDVKPSNSVTLRPVLEWETTQYEFQDQLYGHLNTADFQRLGYGLSVDWQLCERTTLAVNYMRQEISTDTLAKDNTSSAGTDPFTGAPNAGYYGAVIGGFDGSNDTLSTLLNYTGERFTVGLNAAMTNGEGTWPSHYFSAGLRVTYKIKEDLAVNAGYTYFRYDESNNANINNYNANMLYAGIKKRF